MKSVLLPSPFLRSTNGEVAREAGRRGSLDSSLPKKQADLAQILCTKPSFPRNLRNAWVRADLAFLPEWPFSGFRTPHSCPSDGANARGTILG